MGERSEKIVDEIVSFSFSFLFSRDWRLEEKELGCQVVIVYLIWRAFSFLSLPLPFLVNSVRNQDHPGHGPIHGHGQPSPSRRSKFRHRHPPIHLSTHPSSGHPLFSTTTHPPSRPAIRAMGHGHPAKVMVTGTARFRSGPTSEVAAPPCPFIFPLFILHFEVNLLLPSSNLFSFPLPCKESIHVVLPATTPLQA